MPEGIRERLIEDGLSESEADQIVAEFEADFEMLYPNGVPVINETVKSVIMTRDGIGESEAESRVEAFRIELYRIFDSVGFSPEEIESGITDRNPNLIPIEALLKGEALLEERFGLQPDYLEEFVEN